MQRIFKNLIKVYKNLSIKKKILLIFYIQIIVPLILIGFMSYKISSDIIQKKSVTYSEDILHMIQLRLKDYIYNLNLISQELLYDKTVYAILDGGKNKHDIIEDYENEDAINNILKKVILSRVEVQSICFISKDKKYYYFDNNSKKGRIKDLAPFDKIYTKARAAKGRAIWYLDSHKKQVENIFLARTIYNQSNFKEIGLMVIMVKKELLETVYQDLETKNMENIAIISDQDEVLVSRNPDSSYIFNLNLGMDLEEKAHSIIDHKAGTLISQITLADPSWRIVSFITLKELYREIATLRQWLIVLCLLSVLILSVLSVYFSIDIIKPVKRLVSGMEKLQKGEDNVKIDIDREDELGFLSRAFNAMAKEIHYLVNWVYREQITRKEAEIKALQSQINPHFLFNTLESINWMAQLNQVPEISETVSDLSALMEASIGRDDKLIALAEEFDYTDKYISLIKRRFEDKIELVKEFQESALSVKIPRLLIQPLIENAVHHGIEKSREKGIIFLTAYIKEDKLIIEVKDNGLGIEKDELDRINEKLSMDNDTYFKTLLSKKNKSIGIENVNRRIKLFYGEKYGLEIKSQVGQFTTVIVVIPLTKDESKEEFYVQGEEN